MVALVTVCFFFSSRRRHTRYWRDWSSDVCSSDLQRGNSAPQGQPVLSLRGVNKSFGAVHVLRGVDLDTYAGKVTALVGDNGAGKSTLIKSVAGIHPFDDGDMFWEGDKVHVAGPQQANSLGIEIVYQDLALSDNRDVAKNMCLGRAVRGASVTLKVTG